MKVKFLQNVEALPSKANLAHVETVTYNIWTTWLYVLHCEHILKIFCAINCYLHRLPDYLDR